MTYLPSTAAPPSPPASIVIDIPSAAQLSFHLSPPTSPSQHSRTSSPLSAVSLERYWPLIAVTIASIYLITLVPFVAPGLFLIQFSLLRYIRHHHDKTDAHNASHYHGKYGRGKYGGRRWMREAERVRRRSLRPPAMAVIVEETNEDAAAEDEQQQQQQANRDKALLAIKHFSPLRAHRPPPLIIPNIDMGTVTRPTPVLLPSSAASEASSSTSVLPAVFPLSHASAAWHEASHELSHLLSSSMQLLHVERQISADNLMAATAALFVPSLLQPLASTSRSPSSACSASPSFGLRASSIASTVSTDEEEDSSLPFSPPSSRSPSLSLSMDDATVRSQRRDTKHFSFNSVDECVSELSVDVVERGLELRMAEVMCVV